MEHCWEKFVRSKNHPHLGQNHCQRRIHEHPSQIPALWQRKKRRKRETDGEGGKKKGRERDEKREEMEGKNLMRAEEDREKRDLKEGERTPEGRKKEREEREVCLLEPPNFGWKKSRRSKK